MIRIKLNKSDYNRWIRASKAVEDAILSSAKNLPRLASKDYSILIIRNINSQKYGGYYTSYSYRYSKWKNLFGARQGFWKLKGDLIQAVSFFRVISSGKEDAWMGGVPSSAKDSGGKSWLGDGRSGPSKTIAMYGYVMEHGGNYGKGGHHPGRKLFAPTYRDYIDGGFQERLDECVRTIGRRWG